jgi:hypothetical protein
LADLAAGTAPTIASENYLSWHSRMKRTPLIAADEKVDPVRRMTGSGPFPDFGWFLNDFRFWLLELDVVEIP